MNGSASAARETLARPRVVHPPAFPVQPAFPLSSAFLGWTANGAAFDLDTALGRACLAGGGLVARLFLGMRLERVGEQAPE